VEGRRRADRAAKRTCECVRSSGVGGDGAPAAAGVGLRVAPGSESRLTSVRGLAEVRWLKRELHVHARVLVPARAAILAALCCEQESH
jgi:hypothetical protein